ncbi:MAG: YjbF family lipoprotein [Tabrizicola sp.]|nr:YjbF family lipoprotein [Tabrizicola sp.]
MGRLTAGLAVLALLAACGSEKVEVNPIGTMVGTVAKATIAKAKAKRSGATAQAAAPVTREAIEAYAMPILRVTIPTRGADALVTITDQKGDIVTWSTTDGTTFTFRSGILIQTRGLGADLMSADAPSLTQLMQDGGTHQRVYFFLGADDATTRRTYDCAVKVVGPEMIEVFQKQHRTTRVAEVCARQGGTITNEFWIEGKTVRKSKQLTSGAIGFIETEQVVD